MFLSDRLAKLLLIQVMRSASVVMVDGGMREPSFALFCQGSFGQHLVFAPGRVKGVGKMSVSYPDKQPQTIDSALLQLCTWRTKDIRVVGDGDEGPRHSHQFLGSQSLSGARSTNQLPRGVGGFVETRLAAY